MKNKSFIFALTGAALIIASLFIINYLSSMAHPWFIYPAFGVLWWPLGVYFAHNKNPKAFSVIGSLLIAGFMFLVNQVTSPGFPWFIFPAFGVLWWPLGVYFANNNKPKIFSIIGSLLIAGFMFLVNQVTSPGFPWFIFPAFGVLWWPLTVIVGSAKKSKLFAVVSAVYISAFLILLNYIVSPSVPWFIFPAFGVLWWPLSVTVGAARPKLFALVGSISISGFFGLVNYVFLPNFPWFIFPAFGVLWWPLSVYLAKKPRTYAIVMSLFTLGFLALVNYITSPGTLWFPYAAFNLIWWPLAMILKEKAKTLWFAAAGAVVSISYYMLLYFVFTPAAHPWYLYIVLPYLWWPISIAFGKKAYTPAFTIVSIIIFMAYYSILNLVLTPNYFWAIHLIYPALWALMGIHFGRSKKFFAFSVWAAIVTIVYFSLVNYLTTPHTIWAVYPAFLIIWWPLSMYFYGAKRKTAKSG